MNITKKKDGAFFITPAILYFDERISLNDMKVYSAIYRFAKMKTGRCYASNDILAVSSGVLVGSITRAIRKLEQCGYIYRKFDKAYNPVAHNQRQEIILSEINEQEFEELKNSFLRKNDDSRTARNKRGKTLVTSVSPRTEGAVNPRTEVDAPDSVNGFTVVGNPRTGGRCVDAPGTVHPFTVTDSNIPLTTAPESAFLDPEEYNIGVLNQEDKEGVAISPTDFVPQEDIQTDQKYEIPDDVSLIADKVIPPSFSPEHTDPYSMVAHIEYYPAPGQTWTDLLEEKDRGTKNRPAVYGGVTIPRMTTMEEFLALAPYEKCDVETDLYFDRKSVGRNVILWLIDNTEAPWHVLWEAFREFPDFVASSPASMKTPNTDYLQWFYDYLVGKMRSRRYTFSRDDQDNPLPTGEWQYNTNSTYYVVEYGDDFSKRRERGFSSEKFKRMMQAHSFLVEAMWVRKRQEEEAMKVLSAAKTNG